MSIPVVLGGALLSVIDVLKHNSPIDAPVSLSVPILVTMILGVVSCRWFLAYIEKNDFRYIVIYRLIFGVALLLLWKFL
jgi:undecaprenyl pyrophosphate phosphatase UppP